MCLKTTSLLFVLIISVVLIDGKPGRNLVERIYARAFYHIKEELLPEEDLFGDDLIHDLKVQLCFGANTDFKMKMLNAKDECNGAHWLFPRFSGRSLADRPWRQQEFLEWIDYHYCFREKMGWVDIPDKGESLKDVATADLATAAIAGRLATTSDTCWEESQAVVTENLDRIKARRNSAERWTQEEIDAALAELEIRLTGSAFATCVFREIHNECFAEIREVIVDAGIIN